MSERTSVRRKRIRRLCFEKQKGLCYYCKVPMQLIEGNNKWKSVPDVLCTLEHLYDRFHPLRRVLTPGLKRYAAACNKCNNERGLAHQSQQPKNLLHEKSGRRPANDPK